MVGNWGEVVTRYPYRKVRMDHLLYRENNIPRSRFDVFTAQVEIIWEVRF